MFQTSDPVLHDLYDEVQKLLKSLLSDFLKMDVVRNCDLFTLSLDDPQLKMLIDEVYLGIAATATSNECLALYNHEAVQSVKVVKQTCLEFMLGLVRQIRLHFDLSDSANKLVEFIIPQNAVKCHHSSLHQLFYRFPYLTDVADKTLVDVEWRKQALEELDEIISDESSLKFWQQRLDARTFNGKLKYPNLKRVVGSIMSLSSSNAAVESLFSLLKLVKTDTRNSLKRESLVGVIHTKEGMNANSLRAHKLNVDKELLSCLRNVNSNATDTEFNELIMLHLSQE